MVFFCNTLKLLTEAMSAGPKSYWRTICILILIYNGENSATLCMQSNSNHSLRGKTQCMKLAILLCQALPVINNTEASKSQGTGAKSGMNPGFLV
jgi:hypothetical protein